MLNSVGKKHIKNAAKLNKKSLTYCKKVALRYGWDNELVTSIINLEHSVGSIKSIIEASEANRQQGLALLELHEASRLDIAGSFALSQM